MRITARVFLDEEQQDLVAKDTQLSRRIPHQLGNDLDVSEPMFERFLQVMAKARNAVSCNACWVDWDGQDLTAASYFEVRAAKEMQTSEREHALNRAMLAEGQRTCRGAQQPVRILKPFRFKTPKVAGNAVLSLVGTSELVVGTAARRAFAKAGLQGYHLEPVLGTDSDRPHEHCWQLWSETYLAPALDDGTARRCLQARGWGTIERIGWLSYEAQALATMSDFARTAEPFGARGEPGWIISRTANDCYCRAKLSEWWLRPILIKGSEQQRKYAALWRPALERLGRLEELGGGAKSALELAIEEGLLEGQVEAVRAAIAGLPLRIHLIEEPQPGWRTPDQVQELVQGFRAHGFADIGGYSIIEMPDLLLWAMYLPDVGWSAVVYDHRTVGVWADLAIGYEGDHGLTVSSSPAAQSVAPRPRHRRIMDKAFTVDDLVALARREPSPTQVRPVGPKSFVAEFEQAYEKSIQWQMSSLPSAGAAARFSLEAEQASERSSTRELPPDPDPTHTMNYYGNRFERAGLGRLWPALATYIRPEIVMSVEAVVEKELRVGTSKVGGRPDLPAGSEWPQDGAGAPLSFLAQINLGELVGLPGAEALPASGMLHFFYAAGAQPWGFDPKDKDGFRVLYSPATKRRRMALPKGLAAHERFEACRVAFDRSVKLPEYNEVQALVGEQSYAAYAAINSVAERSKLLGWPDLVQGTMEAECELASSGIYCGEPTDHVLGEASRRADQLGRWRLLLQLCSEREAKMCWGDDGSLYFWIREEDLAERRFERCWVVLQCG